jgi:hypothetical protein
MGKRIARLEQALAVWEDTCYLQKKLYKFMPDYAKLVTNMPDHTGPLVHYHEFRNHVIRDSARGIYDLERFTFSKEADESILGFSAVPTSIFAWNHYSRRVYRLDKSLQIMLSATSLTGIHWDEIRWPFQSFVIELEDPLAGDNGKLYDHIIVSDVAKICNIAKRNEDRMFVFLLLPQELEQYRRLDKKKVEKIFKRENEAGMIKMVKKWQHLSEQNIPTAFAIIAPANSEDKLLVNTPYEKSGQTIKEQFVGQRKQLRQVAAYAGIEMPEVEDEYDYYSLFDKAKHIVASVCLYLSTLPPKILGEKERPEREQEISSELSPAAITNAKSIFHIQCENVLSKESQETISAIKDTRFKRQIRPHWRRGHWRRIPGGKKMENAPRFWILPCLVNKDRLPAHSLPVAGRTTIE